MLLRLTLLSLVCALKMSAQEGCTFVTENQFQQFLRTQSPTSSDNVIYSKWVNIYDDCPAIQHYRPEGVVVIYRPDEQGEWVETIRFNQSVDLTRSEIHWESQSGNLNINKSRIRLLSDTHLFIQGIDDRGQAKGPILGFKRLDDAIVEGSTLSDQESEGAYSKKSAAEKMVQTGNSIVAYSGIVSGGIREAYTDRASRFKRKGERARHSLKVLTRNATPVMVRNVLDAVSPLDEEHSKTRSNANKTNPKVNKIGAKLGVIGKAGAVAAVGISTYNIVTAENKAEAIIVEGATIGGAVAGGEVGAILVGVLVGAVFGPWGAVVGGLIGGFGGAYLGGSAAGETAQYFYDIISSFITSKK